MTHLFPRFNVQGQLAQRPTVGDLSSPVSATCIELPLLLLTAQVLPKRPALRLVCINVLIKIIENRLITEPVIVWDLRRMNRCFLNHNQALYFVLDSAKKVNVK
jgi:hypothetical protein